MAAFAAGLLELQEKGLINEDVLTATNDNCVDAFVSGKAAMFSNGMWALSSVLAKDPEMADKIGFAPYPAMMEDGTPMVLVAEDSGYSISADTEHVEEAKAFLTYLFSADNQKSMPKVWALPPLSWMLMQSGRLTPLLKALTMLLAPQQTLASPMRNLPASPVMMLAEWFRTCSPASILLRSLQKHMKLHGTQDFNFDTLT